MTTIPGDNVRRIVLLVLLFLHASLFFVASGFSQVVEETWDEFMQRIFRHLEEAVVKDRQSHSDILNKELPKLIARIERLELTSCNVLSWLYDGTKLKVKTFANDEEFVRFIDQRIQEHSNMIEAYVDRVMKEMRIAPDNREVETALRKLATRVAANEQTIGALEAEDGRINRKLDTVYVLVVENMRRIHDMAEAIAMTKKQYNTQADSFCKRFDDLKQRVGNPLLSEPERNEPQIVNRPGYEFQRSDSEIEIDGFVQNRGQLCGQTVLIKRCVNHFASDRRGNSIWYHGDAVRDCAGRTYLVLHTPDKTQQAYAQQMFGKPVAANVLANQQFVAQPIVVKRVAATRQSARRRMKG